MGMAAGMYDPGRFPAQARVGLDADGTAVAEAAASDMGPGTYTAQAQVAADALGLTMRTVTLRPATRSTRLPRRPRRTAVR
jgi:xanthine dehydrogenase YagR molybdenum-binding subunit